MSDVKIPGSSIGQLWLRRTVIAVTLPLVLPLQFLCNITLIVFWAPLDAFKLSTETAKCAARQWRSKSEG